MNASIAALPMYDWPEVREKTDGLWAEIAATLSAAGFSPPANLERNFPNLDTLWRDPNLLFAQTCWGPMNGGLAQSVHLIGQPSYAGIVGGTEQFYCSAILMRGTGEGQPPASDGRAILPKHLRGLRFAYNSTDSMSGLIGFKEDLAATQRDIGMFSQLVETAGHRSSIRAVAEGEADICAIDCKSWHMARMYDDAAKELHVVGWTSRRLGLPYICAGAIPKERAQAMRDALLRARLIVA